jgi:hypothetical protein
LSAIITPFAGIHGNLDLFHAQRGGVEALLAATGKSDSADPQGRLLELLAGGNNNADLDTRDQIVKEMQRALDAQRIVSLTALYQIAAIMEKAAAGQPADTAAAQKLAARISEIQLPRAPLSTSERSVLSLGYWSEKHIDNERRLNLRAMIDRADPHGKSNDADRAHEVEAALAPLLRDTLVAYSYVHYAPPGAQILYTNPLFVRDHDFIGMAGIGHPWKPTQVFGVGWPSNGGGRLIGSLSSLPYALAEAEQNFLVPTRTQALIWSDLVPQMLVSATIPRWWDVTPVQMHWVALHMRVAESLLAHAALDPALRSTVVDALRAQVSPNRVTKTRLLLETGNVQDAIENLTPIELYLLACSLRKSSAIAGEPPSVEIAAIGTHHGAEVSEEAISSAFGTPKPTLANSYRSELLNLRTFPTLMGYSSRIMAESWESNTLFWASVADQIHLPPAQLNVMIPEWTRKVVEDIFASHLEDWPALLKSLRSVGENVQAGKVLPENVPAGGA